MPSERCVMGPAECATTPTAWTVSAVVSADAFQTTQCSTLFTVHFLVFFTLKLYKILNTPIEYWFSLLLICIDYILHLCCQNYVSYLLWSVFPVPPPRSLSLSHSMAHDISLSLSLGLSLLVCSVLCRSGLSCRGSLCGTEAFLAAPQ